MRQSRRNRNIRLQQDNKVRNVILLLVIWDHFLRRLAVFDLQYSPTTMVIYYIFNGFQFTATYFLYTGLLSTIKKDKIQPHHYEERHEGK